MYLSIYISMYLSIYLSMYVSIYVSMSLLGSIPKEWRLMAGDPGATGSGSSSLGGAAEAGAADEEVQPNCEIKFCAHPFAPKH
jgi:hypothetical protein